MKQTTILKSFRDLPSVMTQAPDASSPTTPESSAPAGHATGEEFREVMPRRAIAPFPYQQWGLNE